MEIAVKRVHFNVVAVGLFMAGLLTASPFLASQAWSQTSARTAAQPTGEPELVPLGSSVTASPKSADPDWLTENNEPDAGGTFGGVQPEACEACGAGCLPPCWTIEMNGGIWTHTRPANRLLTTSSEPGGPFQVTGGTATPNVIPSYRFANDAVVATKFESHTLEFDLAPVMDVTLTRFLGRDGEDRDHFLDITFTGLSRWSATHTVPGTIVPIYSTATFTTDPATTQPVIIGFQGSLNSPFPFPVFTTDDPRLSNAFNRAVQQTATYNTSLNDFEANYRLAGHNDSDQQVMFPNGRWYRQCKTGFYYSYLFGFRAMVADEKFEYQSVGNMFDASGNLSAFSQGRYVVRTDNNLVGVQTGGVLEYRFCRYTFDAHGKVGGFVNFAEQTSHIQTSEDGLSTLDELMTVQRAVAAAAGGFGTAAKYKITPDWTIRASFDANWIGGLALATDQLHFVTNPSPTIITKGAVFTAGMSFWNGIWLVDAAHWDNHSAGVPWPTFKRSASMASFIGLRPSILTVLTAPYLAYS